MTTEQSRREFQANVGMANFSGQAIDGGWIYFDHKVDALWRLWQASRTSLLTEIQSPECVEEVRKALIEAGGDYSLRIASGRDVIEAQAAISVIVKKLKGEK